ncbi:MAG: terminase small subunit [Fusobacteriaceae bacterium]
MARVKDPKRELAFKLWRENTSTTNREIAKVLEVDEKKIATWKIRDEWKERLGIPNVAVKKKQCSTTKNESVVLQKDVVLQKKEKETDGNKDKILKEIYEEILNDDVLTEKQRMFCVYYMRSFNAVQSALKAGYNKNFARSHSYTILANEKIKKYLSELKKSYEHDDYMTTKALLERHKKIAFSDYKEFVNVDGELANLSDVDGTLIKKVTVKRSVSDTGNSYSSTIELEDRAKSLDFLNKFYGIDPTFQLAKERMQLDKSKNTPNTEKEKDAISTLEQLQEILDER